MKERLSRLTASKAFPLALVTAMLAIVVLVDASTWAKLFVSVCWLFTLAMTATLVWRRTSRGH